MTAAASDETISGWDFFALYTRCVPINLEVRLDAKNWKLEFSEDVIRNRAELKLRAARLYDPDSQVELDVGVVVVGNAFAVDVSFEKFVVDNYFAIPGASQAQTWEQVAVGYPSNQSHIVDGVSAIIDQFLVDYFRVNDADCPASGD